MSSPWLDAETRSFTDLLKRGKYDALVAPIRSEGYALDRISRSLILAQVSRELEARKIRVPNPVILSRAVGESRRRFEPGELSVFAKAVGIEKVVIVGVAHDRQGHVRTWVGPLDPKSPASGFDLKPLPDFTLAPGEHPSAVAKVIAPAVVALLAPSRKPEARARTPESKRAIFDSPREAMAVKGADLMGRAVALQLIASLAPAWPDRSRERLFEQALIAARELPRAQPYSAFFVARAWYHLEARESALAALAGSSAPEVLAYREFLNGNLPELMKAVTTVKDELPRLLLEIDLKTIEAAYGHPDARRSSEFLDTFASKYPQWSPLIARRLGDLDPWNAGDVVLAKRILDRDLAMPGGKLEDEVSGIRLTGGEVGPVAITKLALRHVERGRRELPIATACLASADPCIAGAYLDLLEAIAVSDAMRALKRLASLQGLPQQARELAAALKPELDGHPGILMMEGVAQLALAEKMPAAQREPAIAELHKLALAAAWLEQGQSRTSAEALRLMGVPSPHSGPFVSAYRFDLPLRSYWYAGQEGGGDPVDDKTSQELHRRQLAASTMDLERVGFLMRDEAGKAELRKALADRFKGNPLRPPMLQALATTPEDRTRASQTQLQDRPDSWSSYAEQGRRLIEDEGDYKAAAAAFGRYPGFSDPSRYQAVELSNQAYAAGSVFFWKGRLNETRRFYGIAADLGTGSDASLASKQRLAQMDGDYKTMLEAARTRGQRYNDPYAWRDFLSWLMVLGEGDQAWKAFTQLHAAFDNPQVWLAADAGLRLQGGDWANNRQWLFTEPYKSSRSEGVANGLRLALMLSAIDRSPAPDLVKTLRELAGPPNTRFESDFLFRGNAPRSFAARSKFRVKTRGPVRDGTLIDSEFVYFGEAYIELRRGNFRGAVDRFNRMAEFYPIEGFSGQDFSGFALPYFAWASAKSGDPLGLEEFVRALPDAGGGDFDRELALAFFSGLRGEHDIARRHLEIAFYRRPFTDKRPIFTEYQWAEACEWLYLETRQKAYLSMALDWAHRYQQVMPVSAWAYAFEAKYTTDEKERLRATAIALYLDPRSERLASVPADVRERAKKWLSSNNPFTIPASAKGPQAKAPGNRLLQSPGRAS